MIIRKADKTYFRRSDAPNGNFTGESDDTLYIVDETTANGETLADKIVTLWPNFDFVVNGSGLIDVTASKPSIADRLASLNAVYQPQFDSLSNAYMIALMNNDTATMSDIKSEYDALQTQYNTQKTGIENA